MRLWWCIRSLRIKRHIAEHVVHPAHVPFEIKAKPAHVGRRRDGRPRRGIFSDHEGVGIIVENRFIQAFQKANGIDILGSAKFIVSPKHLRRFIKMQVNHAGDGVHAKAVDMKNIHPEDGIGDQKALHFRTAEVKGKRSPSGFSARFQSDPSKIGVPSNSRSP